MPKGRRKLPGSFQDELGEVIERIATDDRKRLPTASKAEEPVRGSADLNDRLFWRRPGEKA
jgi:hypothetical protein